MRSIRLNSRVVDGTDCGSLLSCCSSRGVRARKTAGVPSDVCVDVRSGTTISRTSESITPALAPSTERRSCIGPGFASNSTRDGARGELSAPAAEAPGSFGDVDASTASGTRPRNTGEPSGATAITDTRAGGSFEPPDRSPGGRGIGSQTNVTLVLPFSPRDVPIHVRIERLRAAAVVFVTLASADLTSGGSAGFGGAVERATSSLVRAQ